MPVKVVHPNPLGKWVSQLFHAGCTRRFFGFPLSLVPKKDMLYIYIYIYVSFPRPHDSFIASKPSCHQQHGVVAAASQSHHPPLQEHLPGAALLLLSAKQGDRELKIKPATGSLWLTRLPKANAQWPLKNQSPIPCRQFGLSEVIESCKELHEIQANGALDFQFA